MLDRVEGSTVNALCETNRRDFAIYDLKTRKKFVYIDCWETDCLCELFFHGKRKNSQFQHHCHEVELPVYQARRINKQRVKHQSLFF